MRGRRSAPITIACVSTLSPLITPERAALLDAAVSAQAETLSAGLLLATKSGAWLEGKARESQESAATLSEIQLAVALHADRMGAVTALLRAAETRAQIALMSANSSSRRVYADAKVRFDSGPTRR